MVNTVCVFNVAWRTDSERMQQAASAIDVLIFVCALQLLCVSLLLKLFIYTFITLWLLERAKHL